MACIFYKMPCVFFYVMTGEISTRIVALFKAWRMKNIPENIDARFMEKRGERMTHGHVCIRFKKYGFVCFRGLLPPARQTVSATLRAFRKATGGLSFQVIPFVVVVVRIVVVGI